MNCATVAKTYNALAALHRWPVYCDPTLSFDNPELQALPDVLAEAKGDKLLPARSDLTVRLMKDHVTDMTIYECLHDGRWRVRLMGTRFANTFGDLTGKIISEYIPPDRVPRFEATLNQALLCDGPMRFLAHADVVDKEFLVGEYLVAPLLDEAGERTMVLSRVHFSTATDWPSYLDAALSRISAKAA